jgi:phage-related protein
MMLPKPVYWLGNSRERVREFPANARARAGYELWQVQQAGDPSDWKPMSSIGPGASEIRIHAGGEYRVLYVAKFVEAVYVLHAFGKTTRRTPQRDLDLAAAYYRVLVRQRSEQQQ